MHSSIGSGTQTALNIRFVFLSQKHFFEIGFGCNFLIRFSHRFYHCFKVGFRHVPFTHNHHVIEESEETGVCLRESDRGLVQW